MPRPHNIQSFPLTQTPTRRTDAWRILVSYYEYKYMYSILSSMDAVKKKDKASWPRAFCSEKTRHHAWITGWTSRHIRLAR